MGFSRFPKMRRRIPISFCVSCSSCAFCCARRALRAWEERDAYSFSSRLSSCSARFLRRSKRRSSSSLRLACVFRISSLFSSYKWQ